MSDTRRFVSGLRAKGAVPFLALCFVLVGSLSTAFAATIAAVAAGNGVYAVIGSGVSGLTGLKMTVNYDTSTLGNPRVEKGGQMGNALVAANTNQPGVIQFALVSTSAISSNNVTLATITFDRKGESAGLLTGFTVNEAINASGAPFPVTTSYSNAVIDSSQTAQAGSSSSQSTSDSSTTGGTSGGSRGTPSTGSTGAPTYLGTVSMPGDAASGQTEKKVETQKADQQPSQGQETAASGQASEPGRGEPEVKKAPAERKNVVYPSVSDDIRKSTEKLTMEKLLALFDHPKELPYVQSPPVVLSDGKASVKLSVRLADEVKSSPSFALEHAKLLSLSQGEGGEWLIEALPAKDVNDAALTVTYDESSIRIPLTVAQSLGVKQVGDLKVISDKTFPVFLKERGTKDAPKYDLNGDGKRDYLDDYIFAANYLAGGGKVPAPDKRPASAVPKQK